MMSLFLWVNAVEPFASVASADLFEVVDVSTCCAHFFICWASSGQMTGTTVLECLSCVHSGLFLWLHPFCLCTLFLATILSESFVSVVVYEYAKWHIYP